MGVKGLWKEIKLKCSKEIPLTWKAMHKKKVAIDMTFWMMESNKTKSEIDGLLIRNTFFRIKQFIELGVKLIFVFDGKPWNQKKYAYKQRYNITIDDDTNNLFDPTIKYQQQRNECKYLLNILNIPYIQLANGDAEAFCAKLNCLELVDAVITPDIDGMLIDIFSYLLL